MFYAEMSNEQRRQLIDAQQLFSAWWPVEAHVERNGALYWNTSKGRRYLYKKKNGISKSIGRETPELAAKKLAYDDAVKRARPLARRIEKMAPVNRALRLGRMPEIASRIIREIDRQQLLGTHIIVCGTNALYAYEAACGVFIGGEHVATGDADLLWDTRQSLLLTATGVRRDGLMSILRRVDKSFVADYGMNATNKDGYIVDLLCPESDDFTTMRLNADLEAVGMPGAEWLLQSPQFEQVIIGGDGVPLRMVVPEPRTYALHKLWVSGRADRTPIKRPRDRNHASIVHELVTRFLGQKLVAKDMPWLPRDLKALTKDLKKLQAPDT